MSPWTLSCAGDVTVSLIVTMAVCVAADVETLTTASRAPCGPVFINGGVNAAPHANGCTEVWAADPWPAACAEVDDVNPP